MWVIVILDFYDHMPMEGVGPFLSEETALIYYRDNLDGIMAAIIEVKDA